MARIGLEADRGEGTGFLMRGSDLDGRLDGLVLVANAHVIDPAGTSGGIHRTMRSSRFRRWGMLNGQSGTYQANEGTLVRAVREALSAVASLG